MRSDAETPVCDSRDKGPWDERLEPRPPLATQVLQDLESNHVLESRKEAPELGLESRLSKSQGERARLEEADVDLRSDIPPAVEVVPVRVSVPCRVEEE